MFEFLLGLLSNLALLTAVLTVCCVFNWLWPDAPLDGVRLFTWVAVCALVFDATLTFLVFADAQRRYGQFSTTGAFAERACAYGLAALASHGFARWRARRRVAHTATLAAAATGAPR
ncbi:hypothetical protein [Paraburkholderia solisilvae]|uniref:Uncharacterized protein n=1 Tax=Paraburkholderia solisilvae TaxID=624376 RepID=A0A6J5EYG3_9BURK|nr:hypothetical protein [Paraburkholderia solisilvae]CAB3771629.1 hypothetical protein LMG29739_06075 [Paraburkholderia solisilvae]